MSYLPDLVAPIMTMLYMNGYRDHMHGIMDKEVRGGAFGSLGATFSRLDCKSISFIFPISDRHLEIALNHNQSLYIVAYRVKKVRWCRWHIKSYKYQTDAIKVVYKLLSDVNIEPLEKPIPVDELQQLVEAYSSIEKL